MSLVILVALDGIGRCSPIEGMCFMEIERKLREPSHKNCKAGGVFNLLCLHLTSNTILAVSDSVINE